jgi:hypothetical protein
MDESHSDSQLFRRCVAAHLRSAGLAGRMRPAVIKSSSDIRVLLDPPMPFTLLPRPVLEQTGNAVMQASLRALQVRHKRATETASSSFFFTGC